MTEQAMTSDGVVDVVTAAQAAEMLGTSVPYIWQLAKQGKLVRIGEGKNHYHITKESVERRKATVNVAKQRPPASHPWIRSPLTQRKEVLSVDKALEGYHIAVKSWLTLKQEWQASVLQESRCKLALSMAVTSMEKAKAELDRAMDQEKGQGDEQAWVAPELGASRS